jgi:hypothetical protein
LQARFKEFDVSVPVAVAQSEEQPPIEYRNEVLQVLTKAGCNTGSCHGSASGKDGFRLSLFGYDPEGDWERLTRELNGRRVRKNAPESCLLIQKAIGMVDHTGGGPISEGTSHYETLVQWIAEGANQDPPGFRVPVGIDVYPKQSVFDTPGGNQKLVVMARFSDGTQRDVTALTVFLSNNEAAAVVDERGMVKASGPGTAFVLARFDKFTAGSSMIVRPGTPFIATSEIATNEIDRLVQRRLRFLHLQPSELCTDEAFLRRVTIDLVGLLPTEEEMEAFLKDSDPLKREKWIDRLLERSEFNDLWVMRWAELLQIRTSNGISPKALSLYDQWLRSAVHSGETIQEIVQELLSSKGGTLENPATNYFQTETTPQLMAENVAQVFLGTRIQCAQCHNHPFDRWTMDDYYGFAAFFSQIGYKQAKDPRELTIYNAAEGEIEHPLGKKIERPQYLGGSTMPEETERDYREVLVDWLASTENPAFRRNIGNIVWAHFFGTGIVDPVDDVRVSNPPSNEELLDYLGQRLAEDKFNIKGLVREICNSRTYQTETRRNASNQWDERDFSHQKIRRMRAEVLLDCICQATGVEESLPGLPPGSRAVQVADGLASHYFLTTFGRSNRNTPCTCEVKTSPTLSQSLHLLNGETTTGKIRGGGLIRTWLEQGDAPESVVMRLYARCYSRRPTESEWADIRKALASYPEPSEGLEDLFWALLNSNEFIFNH